MSTSLLLSWRPGVSASDAGNGTLVVQGPGGRISLRELAPTVLDALRRCQPPGEDEERLAALVEVGGDGALPRWYYYLERLTRRGFLCHGAHTNGTRLATLLAISSSYVSAPAAVDAGCRYVLSRFAYLRREGAEAVLESPLSHARIVLNDCRAAAVVGALAVPARVGELAEVVGLPPEAVTGMLALLLRAGMLREACDAGARGEDDDEALQTWDFHDLLFHARSRKGRSDAPYGATYRLAGRLEPPPALKPPVSGATCDLWRPDLAQLERDDPPLARVQEVRSSVRNYDADRPLTARQLGEFLFRVARVKDHREIEVPTARGPVRMDVASRPYPAGGALYELELYVAVNRCDGLAAGLYHYDPARHVLTRRSARTAEVEGLLRDGADSAAIPEDTLQVLLLLAARFPRVAWKYESIAYALTLKHVGVVYQTMYLAATAMGLAPCAVGGGDADLFARAAGTNNYAETSVGEFLLGSPRPGPAGRVG